MAIPGWCLRYSLVVFNAIATVMAVATAATMVVLVVQYTQSQNGLSLRVDAVNTDLTDRLNVLTALDVTLQNAIVAGDVSVTNAMTALITAINATLTTEITYLGAVLNVTQGDSNSFTTLIEGLVGQRLKSVNGVVGDAINGNLDLVSLNVSNIFITPDTGGHTVGIGITGVVTNVVASTGISSSVDPITGVATVHNTGIVSIVAGSSPPGGLSVNTTAGVATLENLGVLTVTGVNAHSMSGNLNLGATGMIAITTDTNTSTVTVDGSAIVTVLTNLQSMDMTQADQISNLTSTTVMLQTQISSLQIVETTINIALNDSNTSFNVTLTDLIASLVNAQAAIAVLQAQLANLTSVATPTGAIVPWSGALATTPSGYLLCDGASYSTATYPNLFTVIGTMYGGGAGNFNVPDLRGKVPAGHKASGTFNAAVGTVVGEETHTLTTPEVPSHTHTGFTNFIGDHTHTTNAIDLDHRHGTPDFTGGGQDCNPFSQTVSDITTAGLGGNVCVGVGNRYGTVPTEVNIAVGTSAYKTLVHSHTAQPAGSHQHAFTTDATGSGTPLNVVQPSLVIAGYIIKY